MTSDDINAELDRRKVDSAVDNCWITPEDIVNAEVVFICSCDCMNDIDDETCAGCGKAI